MIFNFQLLGLIILAGLVLLIYFKDNKIALLKSTITMMYINQLLYTASYISINQNFNQIIFIKAYLITLLISFSLLTLHYINIGLKNKYTGKKVIYESKAKLAKKLFALLNMITTILIIVGKININKNIILGKSVLTTHIFILMYTFINIISIISYNDNYNKKDKNILTIITIILFVSNIISFKLTRIPAINSSITLIALLLFYHIEKRTNKEIEILQLEREHAQKNNFDKSKFLKDLSHEIRTPLNTIDGFCQVIEDSEDINSIKEDTKYIRQSSKDLIDIINGIIDITIIESGNLEILNEAYNTKDMIKNIIDISKSRLKDSKVKFKVTLDDNIPTTLIGDTERIEQVILSIISNSIKYTEEGHIDLSIASINSQAICRLKITISDTGIGISKEDLNKIFENNNDRNIEKNGLSLRYAKKLIELMDGKIEVSSEINKGTTFIITIDQKNTDKERETKGEKEFLKTFTASNKRILLVDDNKLNIKVATKLLEPYKLEIVEASSGKECLDILEKDNNFDLILMDDLMPNMSGTDTLEIFKKIERIEGYTIPVVVLTANAVKGMKEKYLSIGFNDYLAKPIDKYELNRVLTKYLKNKEK